MKMPDVTQRLEEDGVEVDQNARHPSARHHVKPGNAGPSGPTLHKFWKWHWTSPPNLVLLVCSLGYVLTVAYICSIAKSVTSNPVPLPCRDSAGTQRPVDSEMYKKCAKELQDRDYKVDYSEQKDLAKTFLTLELGILAALLAFSGKMFAPERSRLTRNLILSSLILLFFSIIAVMTCLMYLVYGLSQEYDLNRSPFLLFERASGSFLVSLLFFMAALIVILAAAVAKQKQEDTPVSA